MGCPFCKACFALCSRPVAWEHTGMIVSLPLCVLIQLGLDLDFPGFLFFPDQSSLQVDSETDHISPVVFSWTINACTSSLRPDSTGHLKLTSSTSALLSTWFLWPLNMCVWYSLLPTFQEANQKDSLPWVKATESSPISSATVAQGWFQSLLVARPALPLSSCPTLSL